MRVKSPKRAELWAEWYIWSNKNSVLSYVIFNINSLVFTLLTIFITVLILRLIPLIYFKTE